MNLVEIKFLCQQYGLRPSKGKGQNFLIDETVIEKILQKADLQPTDHVLEIGPGFGILTEQLLDKCQKILAVELDKKLFTYLSKRFFDNTKFSIINEDILKVKNAEIAEQLASKTGEYKLVANLPYAISKPVLRKFLSYEPKPKELIVMLQKEVAEKIIAKSGKMSILALSVQFYAQAEILAYIPATSFYPRPQIESAFIRIKLNPAGLPEALRNVFTPAEQIKFVEKKFWQLIKFGFSSPRKQLHNNLAAGYKLSSNVVKDKLLQAGFEPEIRAEKLQLADWGLLYQQFVV